MRKNLLLAALVSMSVFAIAVSAQKTPDFNGKWTLDVSKSKLGERNSIESQTLSVTQSDKDIKVETATKRMAPPAGAGAGGGRPGGGGGRGLGPGGDMSMTYSLDGKETKISQEGPMGAIPVSLIAKFDGGKLHLSQARTINGPQGEMTITTKETWALSGDGSTLTVERTQASMRGDMTTTLVFSKAK